MEVNFKMSNKIISLSLIGILIAVSNITLAEDKQQEIKYTNGEFPTEVLIKIYDYKNKLITGIKNDKLQYPLMKEPKEKERSKLQPDSLMNEPLIIKFDISDLPQEGEYQLHIYTKEKNKEQKFTSKTIHIIK